MRVALATEYIRKYNQDDHEGSAGPDNDSGGLPPISVLAG
jgi:hypothetical protein